MHINRELLPCPFCGGSGEIVRRTRDGTGASGMDLATVFAGCRECDIWFTGGAEHGWSMARGFHDKKDAARNHAVASWNARAAIDEVTK